MACWLGWQIASLPEAHTCGRTCSFALATPAHSRGGLQQTPSAHSKDSNNSTCNLRHQTRNQQHHSWNTLQTANRAGSALRATPAAQAVVDAEPADLKRRKKLPAMPFVKIVGQEEMKLALLLNVVDPRIGGVLIMGDRGTGKSVAVRRSLHCCLFKTPSWCYQRPPWVTCQNAASCLLFGLGPSRPLHAASGLA